MVSDISFTKAKFWKCALQVNPSSYISYRGAAQSVSEEDYNKRLLEVCLEENIKVVGLADHGNVDSVEKIRDILTSQENKKK